MPSTVGPRTSGGRPSTEPVAVVRAARTEDRTISSKLFVGNLNFQTTQKEVEELFSKAGDIREVFLPVDRVTGRPRGFAFVQFVDSDDAAAAIEKFNGFELGGRPLRVNEATERPQRRPPSFNSFDDDPFGGDGGWGGGGGGGGKKSQGKPKGSRRNMRAKKRSL